MVFAKLTSHLLLAQSVQFNNTMAVGYYTVSQKTTPFLFLQ